MIAAPVRSPNGEFLGALAGMFRLGESAISPFYASIVRLRLGQSGNTYLLDGMGKIARTTRAPARSDVSLPSVSCPHRFWRAPLEPSGGATRAATM